MLQQLPTEILSSVFQELATDLGWMNDVDATFHGNTEFRQSCCSLANLCLTSQRLRTVAEPLLYETYVKPDTIDTPLEMRCIHKYLQTLLQRPDLASHVRKVCIKAWFQPGTLEHLLTDHVPEFWKEEDLERFTKEPFLDDGTFTAFLDIEPSHGSEASTHLLSLYREHLEKLDITHRQRDLWYDALRSGAEDAEISLLLSLTTNVNKLKIVMPNWEYFKRPKSLPHFTRMLTPGSFLQNLTSLNVCSNYTGHHFHELDEYYLDRHQGYPISFVLPFLSLPSLQTANIDGAFGLNILDEYSPIPPLSPSPKRLEFFFCGIHPRVLHLILSQCTNLEFLHCEVAESDWPIYELSKSLYPHRHSLKTLALDLCYWSAYAVSTDNRGTRKVSSDEYAKSFGLFREYTSLKSLTISENMLLKFSPDPVLHEILPCQLQTLHLTECTASVVPSFEYSLDNHAEIMPKLRNISIGRWDPKLDWRHRTSDSDSVPWYEDKAREEKSKDRMERLRDGYLAAGIGFSVYL